MKILMGAALLAGLASAEPLDTILARLDKSAAASLSFAAEVKQFDYTAVLDLTEESSGVLRLKRSKGGVIGVMEMRQPNTFTVHFTGGTVEKYLPNANLVQVYDVRKYTKSTDQYLLLVFGVSGADLRRNYAVTAGAEESLGAVRATRLELVPKNKDALKLFAKIELWIPVGQTYAMQQKVTKTGGRDYLMWVYSGGKVNPGLPDSAFEFKAPAGVSRKELK